MSTIHLALLRGINVGGKHKVSMKPLVSIFENAGCEKVQSYIQSGNIVFTHRALNIQRIPEAVSQGLERQFGFSASVVIRSFAEIDKVIRKNPFRLEGVEESALHVAFLVDLPDSRAVGSLDAERSPGDQFIVQGKEIYLNLPQGMARTKLNNAYFDAKLNTVSTMRNWRTVQHLARLMEIAR